MFSQLEGRMHFQSDSPLKQEEVDIIVALGEKVSQDASGITAADLIGWKAKVDALDKIPHLSNRVLAETPESEREREAKQFETLEKIYVLGMFYRNVILNTT